MAELVPSPFRDLIARLYLEPRRQQAVFDLPERSWFAPTPEHPDMTVRFHDRTAGNASGPASGPHTQMAQNLVLSYVAGGRIMELKTVQINDRLDIPRPCIDMANVGYNVEWSQELRVEESLREYVAGMMLVHAWRFANPLGSAAWQGPAGEPVFDISLGYDLAGISSPKIQAYLDGLRDASAMVEQLRAEIPPALKQARDLDYPTCVGTSLTLSTFHGCPTDEIERICEFLLGERGLDVIVKMNPPTLGREHLEHLLHDVMGYQDIRVRPSAYTASQTFDEALQMVARLRSFAAARGRRFGCKFSNTLEVENHRSFFPDGNEVMYLSGPPLHVITMALTAKFREAAGPDLPISFSAGITADNFASAAACGFVPVTTCSDLLKAGGYGRLPAYLKALANAMEDKGAGSLDQYVLRAFGNEEEARRRAGADGDPVAWAGLLNTASAAAAAAEDDRYHAVRNSRAPKRIDSHLVLFDCLTCDKCVPVCPNDANFTYPLPEVELAYSNLRVDASGAVAEEPPQVFRITKKHQIGNFAEYCNECGNCDTFCPEYGGPYIEKPSFYRTLESYRAAAPRDGFVVLHAGAARAITGRIRGTEHVLEEDIATGALRYRDGAAEITFPSGFPGAPSARPLPGMESGHVVDMGLFHSLRALMTGVLDEKRVNQVNIQWAGAEALS